MQELEKIRPGFEVSQEMDLSHSRWLLESGSRFYVRANLPNNERNAISIGSDVVMNTMGPLTGKTVDYSFVLERLKSYLSILLYCRIKVPVNWAIRPSREYERRVALKTHLKCSSVPVPAAMKDLVDYSTKKDTDHIMPYSNF